MTTRLVSFEPQLAGLEGDSGAMLGLMRLDGISVWLIEACGIVEEYPTRQQAQRRLGELERGGLTLWQ